MRQRLSADVPVAAAAARAPVGRRRRGAARPRQMLGADQVLVAGAAVRGRRPGPLARRRPCPLRRRRAPPAAACSRFKVKRGPVAAPALRAPPRLPRRTAATAAPFPAMEGALMPGGSERRGGGEPGDRGGGGLRDAGPSTAAAGSPPGPAPSNARRTRS